ncbi:MAG TPA: protein translocase subunit SecD [Elusimicrobiota bacterium]|nr:protein translocase subunit SecD [Elusimicrobiota bacterium]
MTKTHWRLLIIFVVFVISAVYLAPSIQWYSNSRVEQDKMRLRRHPLSKKILNLGLDLQGGIHMVLELKTEALKDDSIETRREAIERAIEIIRNRIDQYGLGEVLIVAQGDRWIVVQMPGVTDREQARSLIGKTALLEFRLVESPEAAGAIEAKVREMGLATETVRLGQMPDEITKMLPPGTALLPGREQNFYLVRSTPEMTGANLVNARVELGGQYSGFPVVSLEFNPEGAKQFARVTEANIERQLAIVLDGVVQSAPVIRTRIPDGRAIIEGNFGPEESKLLKTVLQAGSLPAPLETVEERTVGPTLGDDSIKAGMMACLIGMIGIFIFMAVYYGWSGMLANMALVLNLLLLLAGMSALHATLTMPGIAGIILTIGMAVDANVLILERIREEIRLGKTVRLCIDAGYEKAFSAIFDGNLTTLIAAVFLFQFGTGPIKGFGVSLMLGLMASMFTAIMVTHTVYELWMSFRPIQKLSV